LLADDFLIGFVFQEVEQLVVSFEQMHIRESSSKPLLSLVGAGEFSHVYFHGSAVKCLVDLIDQIKDALHLFALFLFEGFFFLVVVAADAALEVADLFLIGGLSRLIDLLVGKHAKPGLLKAT
jgi:hypothetical protein